MLQLITGRAGSGKTARIFSEIRAAASAGIPGNILLVPEQYSHEAERELSQVCGADLCLYAEVLSFTRLAGRVEEELGRRRETLDKGGRVLCMAMAVDATASRLRIYGDTRQRPELLGSLLAALDELKSARIAPETLYAAAERASGTPLGDKLQDLSLIAEAYAAVVARGKADSADRLDLLAENLSESTLGAQGRIFVDGFTDFTAQELQVLRAFLRKGADLTVCLTCDERDDSELFESTRRTLRALREMAAEYGQAVETAHVSAPAADKAEALRFVEANLFGYGSFTGETGGSVRLFRSVSAAQECELAAAACLACVREQGMRWRDIAIAIRGFERYRPLLESTFAHYGVPLFVSRKSALMQKPLPALVSSAFEILSGGWTYEAVFTYLKTGLTPLSLGEMDELENYVLLWSIRGSAWTREADWVRHPGGFNQPETEESRSALARINAARRRVCAPLLHLQERGRAADTALGQLQALLDFFLELELPARLSERARALEAAGQGEAAAEYSQLWRIVVGAMEQCAQILGDRNMTQGEFARLFCLVLSQYDVGTIPISLDRVSAGDFDRMRRRNLRCLIVLGASDDALPAIGEGEGVFSDEEREALLALEVDLGDRTRQLYRELNVIYNCLTLPRERLLISYAAYGADGSEQRPSFVITSLARMLQVLVADADIDVCRTAAPAPALELAARAEKEGGAVYACAREFFRRRGGEARIRRLAAAAEQTRGQLTTDSVHSLYGRKIHLTASRADAFAQCHFAYFLRYGLHAKARVSAGFEAPELGSFMHYILEHTAAAIAQRGGFHAVESEEAAALASGFIEQYIDEELQGFAERSPRFIYLFRRLEQSVRAVVLDMVEELRRSDFVPLDFELNFSAGGDVPPVSIGAEETAVDITGVVDRVDGYVSGDSLYLRVMDYKTGTKRFSLSDVWYGLGLQMLLYLFALEKCGAARYGRKIVPAGVLYVPARDFTVSAGRDLTDEELERERAKKKRRSGLILDDAVLLEAMEHGGAGTYIPVKFNKEGRAVGDALVSAERLALLSRHIEETMEELSRSLHRGDIAADPYFKGSAENACLWCEFASACQFDEAHDARRYIQPLKPQEVWTRLEGGKEHG